MKLRGMDPLDVWIYQQTPGECEYQQQLHDVINGRISCVARMAGDSFYGGFSC